MRLLRLAGMAAPLVLATTLCGPSAAQPASDAPAPVPAGIVTAQIGPRQLTSQTGLTASLLPALVKIPGQSTKSYDLWQIERLDHEIFRSFQTTPARKSSSNPAAQDPQDTAALKAAYQKCLEDEEDDGDCFRQVGTTDYENALGDPDGFALSKETQLFRPKLDGPARASLAAEFTVLMELIRTRMQADTAPGAVPLQRVSVVIGGVDDLNIESHFGDTTVRFGEAAVRTIFQQSFHRAIYATRLFVAEAELYDDCEACDSLGFEQTSYVLSPARYLHFITKFPNLRVRAMSNRWWVAAVKNGCRNQLTPDLVAALDDLAEDEKDLRALIPADEIRKYSACANDGKVGIAQRDLKPYLEEVQAMVDSDYEPEYLFDLMRVTTEGSLFYTIFSAELAKSFAFLLSHESYHLWVSPNAGPQAELAADSHGVQVFLGLFPEIDLKTWYEAADTPGIGMVESDGEASRFAQVGSSLMGRDPTVLLRELYRGARFTQDDLHPPVEDRVQAVSSAITDRRIRFTCDAIRPYQLNARNLGFEDDEIGTVCPATSGDSE